MSFLAVIQQPTPHAITTITVSTTDQGFGRTAKTITPKARHRAVSVPHTGRITPGNRTGLNNLNPILLLGFLAPSLSILPLSDVKNFILQVRSFKFAQYLFGVSVEMSFNLCENTF